jgi:hypothetical protein
VGIMTVTGKTVRQSNIYSIVERNCSVGILTVSG